MTVRQNCAYPPAQVRLYVGKDKSGLVWIDAVCIDHSNIDERNAQVAQMGDLYRHAEQVYACVGPEDGYSTLLATRRQQMYSTAAIVTEAIVDRESCNSQAYEAQLEDDHHRWIVHMNHGEFEDLVMDTEEFTDLITTIGALGEKSYWSRVWVTQEIILAGEDKVHVLWDRDKFQMEYIRFIRMIIYMNASRLRDVLNSLHLTGVGLTFDDNGTDAMEAMIHRVTALRYQSLPLAVWWKSYLEHLYCVDPRDRVYGILNLVRWPTAPGSPRPDYESTVSDMAVDSLDRVDRTENWDFVDIQRLVQVLGLIEAP
jgi:hypothetical protein